MELHCAALKNAVGENSQIWPFSQGNLQAYLVFLMGEDLNVLVGWSKLHFFFSFCAFASTYLTLEEVSPNSCILYIHDIYLQNLCKSIPAEWEEMMVPCVIFTFHLGLIKVRFRIIYSKKELLYQCYQMADSDMFVWTFAIAEMWKQSLQPISRQGW